MSQIYISYSRQDAQVANEVSALLHQCGYQTFLDVEDRTPGVSYTQQLISKLKSADLVVFIVSQASLNSQWCQREIDFAQRIGKTFIPIAVSRDVLTDDVSDFYKSRLSSSHLLVWDNQGRTELPDLLKSMIPTSVSVVMPSSAPPIPESTKKGGSGKGWLRKYGFIIALILFVVSIVVFALLPVGSSSDMSPIPNESEEPYLADVSPSVNEEEWYADSMVEESPDIVASIIVPEEYYDTVIADSTFVYIDPDYNDSETYTPPVVADVEPIPTPQIKEEVKSESTEVSSNSSYWWLLLLILLIGGGVYWRLSIRKFRIKVVSNMDSKLFVDNKEVASLKAKNVEMISLPKGQYYLLFCPTNDKIKERNITISVDRNDELVNMEFQVRPENDRRTIKCFIAGSTHLEAARNALRAGIAQTHNNWRGRNFEILSYTYEDFEKKAVDGGHQNKYDEFIENEATLAVFIISGQIGQYTVNEFEKAMDAFKHSKHPQVLVFNDKNATSHEQSEELKKKVAAYKQYWSDFESLNDLKQQFMHTLDWMLIEMFL